MIDVVTFGELDDRVCGVWGSDIVGEVTQADGTATNDFLREIQEKYATLMEIRHNTAEQDSANRGTQPNT